MVAVAALLGLWLWPHRWGGPGLDGPQPRWRSWGEIVASDTLRAVVVESSVTAFRHRGVWRGYEYELALQAARRLGLQLDLVMAPGVTAALDSLTTGVADVAIAPVAYSQARAHGFVQPCGYTYEVGQVLVSERRLRLEDDSARYSLVVASGSRQWYMIDEAVRAEARGDTLPAWCDGLSLAPFALDTLRADTLSAELMVEAVIDGRWDACLVEAPLAMMLRKYYKGLRVIGPLPDTEDSVAWMVSVGADTLRARLDSVCRPPRGIPHYQTVLKRYYDQSRGRRPEVRRVIVGEGHISPYDALFRQYAHGIGWDWRLVAAVSFVESRFDPLAENNGAQGLMQLMAPTAESFGCPLSMIDDPDSNIGAGVRLLAYLESHLRGKILRTSYPDVVDGQYTDEQRAAAEQDLVKFTLAGYNAGMGHVYDAIALADTLGYDPALWDYNVAHCLTLKADPAYYNLSVVKSGRYNGNHTCHYVTSVLDAYASFREQVAE